MPPALPWLAVARDCFADERGTLQRGLLTSALALVVGLERVWHLDEMAEVGLALLTGGRRCPSRHTVGGWRRHLALYEVDAFCRRPSPWHCLQGEDVLCSYDEHALPRWIHKFHLKKGYVTTRNQSMRDESLDSVPCGYDKQSPDPKRPRWQRGPLPRSGWLVALVYNAVADFAEALDGDWAGGPVRTLRRSFFNRPGQLEATPGALIVCLDPFAGQEALVPGIDAFNAASRVSGPAAPSIVRPSAGNRERVKERWSLPGLPTAEVEATPQSTRAEGLYRPEAAADEAIAAASLGDNL